MKLIIRNIVAVVVGCVVGSILNMSIINISSSIIPLPEGVTDVTTPEGLAASIHLFKPINFLMPFLAHALGTLLGAYLTAIIAASYKMILALLISVVFLVGGIMMIMMLNSPLWYNVVDLVLAYFPMGYLGAKLAIKKAN